MRHLKKSLILLFAFILQNAFGGYIEILGIKPSILTVVVIIFSLGGDNEWESLIYGVSAGVIYDVIWGRVFGLMTVMLTVLAVAVYYIGEFLYKKTATEAAVVTFFGTIVVEALCYGANFTLFGEGSFFYVLLRIIIPTGAYNAIISAICYHLLSKVTVSKKGENV